MKLTNELKKTDLKNFIKNLGFVQCWWDNSKFEIPYLDENRREIVFEVGDKWLTYVNKFDIDEDDDGLYIYPDWDKDRKLPYKELPEDLLKLLLTNIQQAYKEAVCELKKKEISKDFKKK